ncbi:hypothetical protein HBI56_191300 [Parastagonospora nodorum]|uniref:Uncharacterized protein n=2 Tax=Phaeosphaeria nodorum (strain SN15 / ATCC MYA-4574 / FGSC 10173) TaxID=321614 RepID=A0A7U2IAD1_PHANO|nr:hypothetical protein SNOG_14771 [Parastagonospora nodorum SN15]KAH3908210.1 hypothetical protein HBH56_179140 [Parastagonospora nodorum]EAT77963.1 hypothetical protein SNOG_14771 [Parastagonospora nodorum SN15]KAH3931935.1 hypothetical protein HBH54_090680 [Parastagonospora nodorum]KAH3939286.1 hypothetical protein HBH53_237690 [Parastagonospora nodorum]KAH3956813.1 hypothetical protein HBH51_234810 [Parastagonospora nodorum]
MCVAAVYLCARFIPRQARRLSASSASPHRDSSPPLHLSTFASPVRRSAQPCCTVTALPTIRRLFVARALRAFLCDAVTFQGWPSSGIRTRAPPAVRRLTAVLDLFPGSSFGRVAKEGTVK